MCEVTASAHRSLASRSILLVTPTTDDCRSVACVSRFKTSENSFATGIDDDADDNGGDDDAGDVGEGERGGEGEQGGAEAFLAYAALS